MVCAAAHGLVVAGGAGAWHAGYGCHVVVAHRFDDGTLTYSVYAHLDTGSVAVSPGELVEAGDVLGRVGNSGRATAPHLHFEIRVPRDVTERWEKAAAVDLDRLRRPGLRLPAWPAAGPAPSPAAILEAARRGDSTLTTALACVALADLAAGTHRHPRSRSVR